MCIKSGYNPSAIDTTFKRVMIAIIDTAYYDSLFQFRFVNKATLSNKLSKNMKKMIKNYVTEYRNKIKS